MGDSTIDLGDVSSPELSPCTLDNNARVNTSKVSKDKNKKTWVRDYALPPCRVCGRDGSGLHYGVNTCDPCKGFFQRSMVNQHKYVCRGDNRCQLLKSRRNICSYCRLQKCVEVGMSKDGIRHGRYQLDKKRRDIREIKERHASEALAVRLVEEERIRPGVEKLVTCIWDNRTKYSNVCDKIEVKLYTIDLECMRKCDLTKCRLEDYIRLYSHRSDDSQIADVSYYHHGVEVVSKRVIKFAKSIPGFRDLPLEDQTTLLQESHADSRFVHLLSLYQILNLEPEWKTALGDLICPYITVCQRYVNLQLRPEEIAVIMAFVLFNNATSCLKEPQRVEAMNNQLLDTLLWLLKRNHPNDKMIFSKIVDTLSAIRTLSKFDEDFRMGAHQLMENGEVKLPQLLCELTPPTASTVDLNSTFSNYYYRYCP